MPLSRAVLNASNSPDLAISKFAKVEGVSVTQSIERIEEIRAGESRWDWLKRFICEREKGRCRVCGKKCAYGDPIQSRADAHHIIFKSAGGPDETWNLIFVCRACHDLVHKLKKLFLSGNADERDPMGHGLVKAERQVESGFEVVGWI